MAFETIDPTRFAPDAPASNALFTSIVNDLNFLNGVNITSVDAGGAPLILNGSFESPLVASSTAPDDWTIVAGDAGAAVTIDTDQNHGAQSLQFTRDSTAGHTGGTATSASFFNVSPSLRYQITFMLKSSNTDVSNTVVINWYDASQGALSSTTVYSETAGVASWRARAAFVTPPATAMFAKLVLSGGTATTNPAATRTILFDGISMIVKPPFSEQTVYTSTNTFTVPSGAFLVKARMYGNALRASSGAFGAGYSEKIIPVKPTDSVVVTVSNAANSDSTLVHSPSSTSMAVRNPTGAVVGSNVASGGTMNVTGGSLYPTTTISLEY